MNTFTFLAIIIMILLWTNTTIYTYRSIYGEWKIDKDTGVKKPFTIWNLIGILLLLIPCLNIVLFCIYIIWYLKRYLNPGEGRKCTVYRLSFKEFLKSF